jgi:inorganic triphosphatase YgiF
MGSFGTPPLLAARDQSTESRQMDREIELKLECEPDALERVRKSRALTRLKSGRASAKMLRSVYFDTEDFALMKDGLALRVRETGGEHIQTLKTAPDGDGPATDRGEWEASLGRAADGPDLNRLPNELKTRIEKVAKGANISPRLTSLIKRTATKLKTPEGDEIEFAIDHGVLKANGREMPVSEVELELKRGHPSSLYRLALELADDVPLRIGMRSKAERALMLAGDGKLMAVRAEAIELDRRVSVEDAYATILRHCLNHLLLNEAVAFDEGSSEGLHQMRVALRRMRSAFSAFGDLIGGRAVERMESEAKWLAMAIGRARDFDVFLRDILAPVEAACAGDKGLAALRAEAEKARIIAWAGTRAALRSARMSRFVLELALFIDERGWRKLSSNDADELGSPLADFASDVLDRRYKKVVKLARHIDSLDIEERHDLRKRLKRLRYTLGFFASLYRRSEAKRYLHALAGLQDVFGALNDVEAARSIVRELTERQPRLAEAGKRVLAHHERRARKEWQSALRLWRDFREEEPFWR